MSKVNTACVQRRTRVASPILAALFAVAVAATRTLAQPVAGSEDPTILRAKILAALGDARALAAFASLHAVGTMEGVSGFPGSYELWAQAPASRAVTWDIGYLKQTTASDAQGGWERVAAVRELAGPELARTRRDAQFAPLTRRLQANAPFSVTAGKCEATPVEVLTFSSPEEPTQFWGIDPRSFLPVCAWRSEVYEERAAEVRFAYADYRQVHGLSLPFKIEELRPEGSLKIRIQRYDVNASVTPQRFANPQRAQFDQPVAIELTTLPEHVYKEDDGNYSLGAQRYWGMPFYQSAAWSFDLLVKERYGRYLTPLRASADLYHGDALLGSQQWSAVMLQTMQRTPVARFTPQGEIYGFRHNFSVAQAAKIDRIVYTLDAQDAHGETHHQRVEIPVETYRPRAQLVFPMKGKFLVTSGHEYYELEHKYERSQQFAIDIVALGDDFEFAHHDGATMEDYVGFGRRDILAPAAGTIVYARNDIPDGTVKADFLKMEHALEAIAGNLVIIDHGTGEFSVFCHMRHGSVTVKTGDHVDQGQRIGSLGAAGSPGLPHLHYQLQNGPHIFGNDGLPLVFSNIQRIGWLGSRADTDEHGVAPVEQPRSGVYMIAK